MWNPDRFVRFRQIKPDCERGQIKPDFLSQEGERAEASRTARLAQACKPGKNLGELISYLLGAQVKATPSLVTWRRSLFGRLGVVSADRYERHVCRVFNSAGKDLALELVRTGLAWRTRKYADEQTAAEREAYAAAESSAREWGLGLWSQTDPQDPSECRALKKQRQKCR